MKYTDSELEILQVLWDKQPATVREVHEELTKTKDAGYTTTLKLMQIMFEKGLVDRDASAKTHIYTANVSQQQAQQTALDKMLSTVFQGSTANLVMQALGNHKASGEEIEAIKAYLNQFNTLKK
ncbi:BlaI/MecI/CopY family transcriptional regulator [Mucilaginibacter sp.]